MENRPFENVFLRLNYIFFKYKDSERSFLYGYGF